MLGESGLRSEIVEDDKSLWEEQRARQRAGDEDEAVVRVSGLPALLPTLVEAAERAGGGLVGRAGLGLYWLRMPGASADQLERLREELSPHPCVILDRPPSLDIDPWGPVESGSLELMRRIKNGFDRAGVCSPGTYVGGL